MSDREYEIEVFRAGTPASKGLTEEHIAAAVAAYDAETAPAPIVKGHPEHDQPAHGIIAGFRRDGARLFATLSNVAEEIIEGVRAKKWLNRSMAFWSPDHPSNPKPGIYYPKHIGFLGVSQPAIAGMEPLKFSADEAAIETPTAPDTAVVFALEPTPTVTVTSKGAPKVADENTFTAEERDALIAERDAAKARADQLAADQQTAREAANVAFCADMVTAGKLVPAAKDDLAKVLNAIAPEPLQFAADRTEAPADVLKRLLASAKPMIAFGTLVDPKDDAKKATVDKTTGEGLDAAALAFQAEEKAKGREVTFTAALEHVAAEQGF